MSRKIREVDDTVCEADIQRWRNEYPKHFMRLYDGLKQRLPNGLEDILKNSEEVETYSQEGNYYVYRQSGDLNPVEEGEPYPGPDILIAYSYDDKKIRIFKVKAMPPKPPS